MPPSTALTLTPEEADLSVAAIDAFTVALGGRSAVLDALQVANGTPEVDQITKLLSDPCYAGWSLRKLCTLAGLTIADLFAAYKKAFANHGVEPTGPRARVPSGAELIALRRRTLGAAPPA